MGTGSGGKARVDLGKFPLKFGYDLPIIWREGQVPGPEGDGRPQDLNLALQGLSRFNELLAREISHVANLSPDWSALNPGQISNRNSAQRPALWGLPVARERAFWTLAERGLWTF